MLCAEMNENGDTAPLLQLSGPNVPGGVDCCWIGSGVYLVGKFPSGGVVWWQVWVGCAQGISIAFGRHVQLGGARGVEAGFGGVEVSVSGRPWEPSGF